MLSRLAFSKRTAGQPHAVSNGDHGSAAGGNNKEKVMILGAAGRDFHDFQVYWSARSDVQVVCFTGTQIPGIVGRVFPADLCHNNNRDHDGTNNSNTYPDGINIFDEADMESLIKQYSVDTVALAYSDLRYDTVQSLAARANACGCAFIQLPPRLTMLASSSKPVVAVCASRTGVGKSQTTRAIAQHYRNQGHKVAVVRHPMPYDRDIMSQRCQRYETMADLDRYRCTIEEREEYYPHIAEGTLLFAGVDYAMILHQAEQDADIVIWDGGNNDVPFFKPNLHFTLVDALRPGHEKKYYPGEINVRMADAIIMAKVNALPNLDVAMDQAKALRELTAAPVLFGKSVVTAVTDNAAELVHGKRVLVVDDGPTLTHGGMSYGAGYVLAKQLGAATIIDPRPFAQGSLVQVFAKFPHLTNVLPAMGYSAEQMQDLTATINAAECDAVVLGTPSGIVNLLQIDNSKPTIVARYDLEVVDQSRAEFEQLLDSVFDKFKDQHQQ